MAGLLDQPAAVLMDSIDIYRTSLKEIFFSGFLIFFFFLELPQGECEGVNVFLLFF